MEMYLVMSCDMFLLGGAYFAEDLNINSPNAYHGFSTRYGRHV